MFASSAWAVQIFEVAFSRRMCCSRVASAIRYAVLPCASTETPMMRPGIWRTNDCRVAKNAACGPPYPSGTPNRCELPNTTSAPISPGGVRIARASRSVPTATSAPPACARAMTGARSSTSPDSSGYCSKIPKGTASSCPAISPTGPTRTSIPSGSARALTTSIVCGRQRSLTKNRFEPLFVRTRCISVIASAAAVASSSSEAFATSIPVRSATIVWKFRSDSSRPWAISAW